MALVLVGIVVLIYQSHVTRVEMRETFNDAVREAINSMATTLTTTFTCATDGIEMTHCDGVPHWEVRPDLPVDNAACPHDDFSAKSCSWFYEEVERHTVTTTKSNTETTAEFVQRHKEAVMEAKGSLCD